VRELIVAFCKAMKKGQTIRLAQLYSKLYLQFPDACERLGFTPSFPVENKWKKNIRFGLQDAKHKGLIEHIGSERSGLWKRI
jgi:hypothetical protein